MAVERRAGARREEVLAAVRAAEDGTSVAALVEETGLHENTLRFHLTRLVDDGLVERRPVPGGGPGRPPLRFVATPAAAPGGAYQVLAEVLGQGLVEVVDDPLEAARQIGRSWGRELHPGEGESLEDAVAELVATLDRYGFDPEVGRGDGESLISIRTCPFAELTRKDEVGGRIPCAVHLGMMEGMLERAGVDVGGQVTVSLEPYVEPGCCLGRVAG